MPENIYDKFIPAGVRLIRERPANWVDKVMPAGYEFGEEETSRKLNVSTSDPSGGEDGDVWIKVTA